MNNQIRPVLKRFIIRSIVIFVGWLIHFHGFIQPDGRTNQWLTEKVAVHY